MSTRPRSVYGLTFLVNGNMIWSSTEMACWVCSNTLGITCTGISTCCFIPRNIHHTVTAVTYLNRHCYIWWSCRVIYLARRQLQLSMEHHEWVNGLLHSGACFCSELGLRRAPNYNGYPQWQDFNSDPHNYEPVLKLVRHLQACGNGFNPNWWSWL